MKKTIPDEVLALKTRLDHWRLSGLMTTEVVPAGEKQEAAFFEFPTDASCRR